MSEKKKESILKILIGVLLTGLVVMVAYTFNFHREKTESLKYLEEEKASVIQISDIHAEGVFLKNNGEVKATSRINKIENIKICFHLNESELIPVGEKNLYIQIINPNNNLIGEKKKESFKENELYYSTKTIINYRQLDVEVCALIPIEQKNATEGKYIVHIFDNDVLLSSASFLLE